MTGSEDFIESMTISYRNSINLMSQLSEYLIHMVKMKIDDGVLPTFIDQASKNLDITINGDKSNRSFCYIDDLVDGFINQ